MEKNKNITYIYFLFLSDILFFVMLLLLSLINDTYQISLIIGPCIYIPFSIFSYVFTNKIIYKKNLSINLDEFKKRKRYISLPFILGIIVFIICIILMFTNLPIDLSKYHNKTIADDPYFDTTFYFIYLLKYAFCFYAIFYIFYKLYLLFYLRKEQLFLSFSSKTIKYKKYLFIPLFIFSLITIGGLVSIIAYFLTVLFRSGFFFYYTDALIHPVVSVFMCISLYLLTIISYLFVSITLNKLRESKNFSKTLWIGFVCISYIFFHFVFLSFTTQFIYSNNSTATGEISSENKFVSCNLDFSIYITFIFCIILAIAFLYIFILNVKYIIQNICLFITSFKQKHNDKNLPLENNSTSNKQAIDDEK